MTKAFTTIDIVLLVAAILIIAALWPWLSAHHG